MKILENYGKSVQMKLIETTDILKNLQKDSELVKSEALVDFLTDMPNRKAFAEALTAAWTDWAAGGEKKSPLLLIDMNHLKNFNDEHDHLLISGYVLKFVPKKIREPAKNGLLTRFEGEKFAVIFPVTSL